MIRMIRWLLLTVRQIYDGGFQVLTRKAVRVPSVVARALAWVILSPLAVIFVVIVRAVRPIVLVRVGEIRSEKIGHFVTDASLHHASKKLRAGNQRILDLFYIAGKTCNDQWARMVRRQLSVHWWVHYLIVFNNLIPGGNMHQIDTVNNSRDIWGGFNKTNAGFDFTNEETIRAQSWLKARGWTEESPFVCLLARDSKYNALESQKDWSYHNFRDTDIDTYNKSIESLVAKGYWVVRMGKAMHHELSFHHSHVIDYPFVNDQDDLIDIWLSANCRFFISTGSGIDSIPDAYALPTVYVNFIPFLWMRSYSNIVFVPKHLIWKDTGKHLTLREHLDHSYLQTDQYERAGIEIYDLTDEEIKAAVDEMEQLIAGTWENTVEDQKRRDTFWKIFMAHPDFSREHGWVHPQARVGTRWLKSMGEDFFG